MTAPPTVFYKGVRPNGRDFYSNSVQWAPERVKARKGRMVKHPTSREIVGHGSRSLCETFLTVSWDPTYLPGAGWPMRLLKVEAVSEVRYIAGPMYGGLAFRVIEELDPAIRFGPQCQHVANLIERVQQMTLEDANRVYKAAFSWRLPPSAMPAAWEAARAAAQAASRDNAWEAATDAAMDAAEDATQDTTWAADPSDAAVALVIRDLIGSHGFTQEHYDILTGPVRTVLGRIHPDDEDLT